MVVARRLFGRTPEDHEPDPRRPGVSSTSNYNRHVLQQRKLREDMEHLVQSEDKNFLSTCTNIYITKCDSSCTSRTLTPRE